jgi:hypothetical protein
VCRATSVEYAVKIVDKTQDPDNEAVVRTEIQALQDVCPHTHISEPLPERSSRELVLISLCLRRSQPERYFRVVGFLLLSLRAG